MRGVIGLVSLALAASGSLLQAAQPGDAPPAQLTWQGRTLPECLAALESPDAGVRAEAVLGVGAIALQLRLLPTARGDAPSAESLAGPLLKALEDQDATVRARAVSALANMPSREPGARDKLTAALLARADQDSSAEVRVCALDALVRQGQMLTGPAAAQWNAVWSKAAKDPEVRLRRRAAALVGDHRWSTAFALPILRELLKDRDPLVCVRAVAALSRIDRRAAVDFTPDLIELLRREDSPCAVEALRALRLLGWKDDTCLPALLEAIRRNPALRPEGLALLAQRGRAAAPLLREWLAQAENRRLALEALMLIGAPEASELAAEVRGLTQDQDDAVRALALQTLLAVSQEAADLSPVLTVEDLDRRRANLLRLSQRRVLPPGLLPTLRKLLEDRRDPNAKATVIALFGKCGADATPALAELLSQERESTALDALCGALRALGPQAAAAVPVIENKLREEKGAPGDYRAARWRSLLAAVATPEQLMGWAAGPDAALAREARQQLLRGAIPESAKLFDAAQAQYAKAPDSEKYEWGRLLALCAPLERLGELVLLQDDARLTQIACQEISRRGKLALPLLAKLRAAEAEVKTEAGKLQKRLNEILPRQSALQAVVRQLESHNAVKPPE